MRNISTDPDGYGPEDIVARLKRCIDTGIYGIDYTISSRDKNEELFEKYVITENDRIDVLRKLTVNDYEGWERSDNPDYPQDIVHFFHYKLLLFLRGVEEADKRTVNLYIKLSWTKPEGLLVIISFHE